MCFGQGGYGRRMRRSSDWKDARFVLSSGGDTLDGLTAPGSATDACVRACGASGVQSRGHAHPTGPPALHALHALHITHTHTRDQIFVKGSRSTCFRTTPWRPWMRGRRATTGAEGPAPPAHGPRLGRLGILLHAELSDASARPLLLQSVLLAVLAAVSFLLQQHALTASTRAVKSEARYKHVAKVGDVMSIAGVLPVVPHVPPPAPNVDLADTTAMRTAVPACAAKT